MKGRNSNRSKPVAPKTLNQNQRRLCEVMADPEHSHFTKTKLADVVGVTRTTIYNYLARKDVKEYTEALIDYYTDLELSNVWKTHLMLAKAGDIKAIKLYYEMKQMYIPPQQVVDFKMKDAEATINIITSIPRPDKEG